ncbi:MAG: DMT family transporter [Lachnospiraceae bacterium]|nr:DMT family transporter [Lachnospiraceae bacterium]
MAKKNVFVTSVVFPLLAALIWGTAFTAQSVCADYLSPFWVNALRSFIAAAILLVICAAALHGREIGARRDLIVYSVLSGGALFVASNLQQMGITYGTDSGKAGFITALYAVLVPVAELFFHKKASLRVWVAIVIAVAGLYFLCISGGFSVQASDMYILGAAFAFVFQILALNFGTQKVNALALSCGQFAVTGILSLAGALISEDIGTLSGIGSCLPQLLYIAVFSSCIAYTLQVISLRDGNPTLVSLLYCLESVFAVLSGALLLGERLSGRELLGCALMLCGVVLSQLPAGNKEKPVK